MKFFYLPSDRCFNGFKLNANENFFYLNKNIFFLIRIFSKYIKKLNFYPDTDVFFLKYVLSNYYNISIENFFICNGSDEGLAFIFFLFKNFFLKIQKKSYPFYNVYCNYNNIINKKILNSKILNFKNIIFSNPNSPIGVKFKKKKIIKQIFKKKILIIDEAYSLFNNESYSNYINNNNNLIIIKTFSKILGIANSRIGYIISNKKIIEKINFIKHCFNSYTVSSINSYIAIECFKNKNFLFYSLQNNIFLKLLLFYSIKKCKIYSYCNFILIKINLCFFFFFKKKKFFLRKFFFNNIFCVRITIPNFNIIKKFIKIFYKWS